MKVAPRPLTSAELAVVRRLLDVGGIDDARYGEQLAALRVVGRCDCGCPTVDFALAGREEAPPSTSRPLVDTFGTTPEGQSIGLILWATPDELTGLETYSLGSEESYSLPRAEEIVAPQPQG